MEISVKGALELLSRDPLKNSPLINLLSTHPEATCERLGDSLLIREKRAVYISAETRDDIKLIVEQLKPKDKYIATVEGWVIDSVKGDRKVKWLMTVPRYALAPNTSLPGRAHPTQPLNPEDMELAVDLWSEAETQEAKSYALACLKGGPTSAVYFEGKPVAWAGVHEDGALGFLYTMEEQRGKGYALAVTIDLVRQHREQGKVSYVNIQDGKNSLGLAKKLGFVHVGESCWVEFE